VILSWIGLWVCTTSHLFPLDEFYILALLQYFKVNLLNNSLFLAEPYDYFGRRGRKEPEALAAASLKRLFVENQPYLVGGYCQHGSLNDPEPSGRGVCSKFFCSQQRLRTSLIDASNNILSISEKYEYMRETFRKRLAFGRNSSVNIYF